MSRLRTYVELAGRTVAAGDAHFNFRRGRLTATFSYERDYLALPGAYAVDPALGLATGAWPLPQGLPGAFSDAAPDRWGRNLIAKRLRAEAVVEGRAMPTLDDRDYLLGVSDETRQGALRFKTDADDVFQHPSPDVPKLIALPTLLHAANAVARDEPDNLDAIKTLLDAGTGSLGGARPKASVRDDKRLMIAKFPHHSDGWSVIAWEKTALDLAEAAGIPVPGRQLVGIDGSPVLLLDRFDREGPNRIGYISSMTLLEAQDGQPRDYTEIAEILPENSSSAVEDLRQLWRRIAFSIAIHNTDDHLRNHGFLRRASGWRLAPAFDVNPNPELAAQRVTSVGGATRPADEVSALLVYAENFGLTDQQARTILRDVADAAANWGSIARRNGIAQAEIARFEPTLSHTIDAVRLS
ncbi:type II toxin-antitoxin system HipA family toxin [Actinoplanes derwentensis]|uniref:Serine/threonine-protein kinase HipA n=1 Tax=Actinoplanes derwentensis TaxID=113562 RepID=A0A1H2D350_9ACTN|nr:type II toxin-antitoxin system HipA family toxin [Actinoplanes derwentensis]GID88314.1 phosphatidylinositol kinase [Actinoplanes derwentensis]SDT77180.1 serine/threonine-protein kinase HipA [Actinoplanes derwentensis]